MDAGTGVCEAACANLATNNCPEGLAADCVQLCTLYLSRPDMYKYDAACRVRGKTKAELQQCGKASCR